MSARGLEQEQVTASSRRDKPAAREVEGDGGGPPRRHIVQWRGRQGDRRQRGAAATAPTHDDSVRRDVAVGRGRCDEQAAAARYKGSCGG